MTSINPIDLLFGGMEKLGPGSNVHTLNVLRLLPRREFGVIIGTVYHHLTFSAQATEAKQT